MSSLKTFTGHIYIQQGGHHVVLTPCPCSPMVKPLGHHVQ